MKDDRVAASKKLRGPKSVIRTDRAKFIDDIRSALYASKIISYAQGFMLLRAAAAEYGWKLNYGEIALMWRGGCIIRSQFLGKSRRPSTSANACQICCSTRISSAKFASPSAAGATSSPQRPRKASRHRHSRPRSTLRRLPQRRLPANLCRPNATTSARTPTSASTGSAASISTNWTGRGGDVSSTTYDA